MGSTLSTLTAALTDESEATTYNGSPSEFDVHDVRIFLIDYFPLELVDIILDYAEYWPCVRADTNRYTDVLASVTRSGEGTWLYLISPPVPPREAEGSESDATWDDNEKSGNSRSRQRKVRKVQFEMESHDQGWGGQPGDRGTYNGSWSWFEAIIYRASTSPCWLDLTQGPVNLGSKFSTGDIEELFPDPRPNRWHVQNNLTATDEVKRHCVTWTEAEEDFAAYADGYETDADGGKHRDENSLKGREGCGHELVRSLEPGDRVMLLAKAKFRGWENHVFAGSISIYYST